MMGVAINLQDANNTWTANDAANHRIAFLMVPVLGDDPDKVRHKGFHHTAFEHDGFDDLMASRELQSDAFGNWAKSTAWMRTSEDFRGNPIGTLFNPQAVPDADRGGMSFETLSPAMQQANSARHHSEHRPARTRGMTRGL